MKSFAIPIIVLLVVSCENVVTGRLNQAEDLLSSRPDSALALLGTINPKDLNTEPEEARYALLMSAALDKNYIDVCSDSLILKGVNYYSKKGNDRDKMLAWYYYGIVLSNASKHIPAILALEKAENHASVINEWLYLGLIYRNKATLFSETNNNPAAIENRIKAVECFEKAGEESYLAYAQLSLAIDYGNDLNFQKADSLLRLIREQHSQLSSLIGYCNLKEAGLLVKKESDWEKALTLFRKSPRRYYRALDYSYLARAFEAIGQRDSADYWLSEGYRQCNNKLDSATLDYMRSRLELSREHYLNAFHLVDHAASVQDSLTRILLQQSVSVAQRDYYKNEASLREERIRTMKERNTWGICLSILLLFLLIMGGISWSRKKDRFLQEQMARLALNERELDRVNMDNAHLIGSLFSERIDHLDELAERYFREEDEREKEKLLKQVKQLVSGISKDEYLFHSMEKDLDRYCNGIMSKLRNQVPRIKGENLKIISFFFAGFPYGIVQLIFNKNSVQSLKTARSRFRKEILAANALDADFFLKMLDMKKRPQADTNENKGDC
jgi:hypothetical protein